MASKQTTHLSIYGLDILCGISKGTFEIPLKISYPNIENFVQCWKFKSSQILEPIGVFEMPPDQALQTF